MILIIDDRPETLFTYINELKNRMIDWDYSETIDEAIEFIQEKSGIIECCLIDLYMPGNSRLDHYQQFFNVTVNQGQSLGLFLHDNYPSIKYFYLTNNPSAYSPPQSPYKSITENIYPKSSTRPVDVIKIFDEYNIGSLSI